ncbi:hypothetical protein D3C80_1757480 [compost metagenome]
MQCGKLFLSRHARKQQFPYRIHYLLQLICAAGNRDDGILLRHNDTELAKSPVAPVNVMPASPELVTIAL